MRHDPTRWALIAETVMLVVFIGLALWWTPSW